MEHNSQYFNKFPQKQRHFPNDKLLIQDIDLFLWDNFCESKVDLSMPPQILVDT